MEKNVIGATQAQPIEPLVYFVSPVIAVRDIVIASVSGVPMIDYNRKSVSWCLKPKNLFPIN